MKKRKQLKNKRINDFPFDKKMILFEIDGIFPDMGLRRNISRSKNPLLSGGEFVEMKNSERGHKVTSFNSTIPSGKKNIIDVIKHPNFPKKIVVDKNENKYLPVRQVYYLARSKYNDNVKVCLVHGSFFDTVKEPDLISNAFCQVMEDAISEGKEISPEAKKELILAMTDKNFFSPRRKIAGASVLLHFRVITETIKEMNIMTKWTEISDNTLSLIVPLGNTKEEIAKQKRKIIAAARTTDILNCQGGKQLHIKHPLNNRCFWVLRIPI